MTPVLDIENYHKNKKTNHGKNPNHKCGWKFGWKQRASGYKICETPRENIPT